MAINILLCIVLICMSIDDIKNKSISLRWTLFSAVLLSAVRILTGYRQWIMMFCGVIPGLLVLITVKLSGIKVGTGDSICLIIIGIVKGALFSIKIIVLSFFVTSICCIILLILRRVKRSSEIPMIPFITISCMGVILCG